ncbi:hypothetical protein [Streptomyces syringium]|uniref:Transposase n=1 Tax=Streptomyces syringium TaxID=76729 RepID=A0ABS4XW91_9ACTN|nr:hypothetical protein [Streptomyces syringium]MBP2400773.1 hypothetical protein [Streptomyces syringium]
MTCSPNTPDIKRRGRKVAVTRVTNDVRAMVSRSVSRSSWRYACDIHDRAAFFRSLARHRPTVTTVIDLTHDTHPYWLWASSEKWTRIDV